MEDFKCGSGVGRFASSILGDGLERSLTEVRETSWKQYGLLSRGCQRRKTAT